MPTTQRLKELLIEWDEADRAYSAAGERLRILADDLKAEARANIDLPRVYTLASGDMIRLHDELHGYISMWPDACGPKPIYIERFGKKETVESA